MKNDSIFKTVVFFNINNQKSEELKQSLEPTSFIKVFQTKFVEEVKQIVDMSSKSAIIFDDHRSLKLISTLEPTTNLSLYRIYFLDWENIFSHNEISDTNEKITLIKPKPFTMIIEKLELYLFGRLKVFGVKGEEPRFELNRKFGKGFFTHCEFTNEGWKLILSSHEREDNISLLIGKKWEDFLAELFQRLEFTQTIHEERLFKKNYYEIIYPHLENGRTKKVSIIHLNVDVCLQENIAKIKNFLHAL